MGLDYGYISIIRKEDKEKAYNFIAAHGEPSVDKQHGEYHTLFFDVDNVITKYLQQSRGFQWLPFRTNIDEFLCPDKRAKIGYVWILEEMTPGHEEYIQLSFYAVSTPMSVLFRDSPSIKQWFLNFSKALNAKMTYADFETEGTQILYWEGKEINITLANDEYLLHSRNEFIDIMSFFASQTTFFQP